jgi:hypothetical protein
MLYLVFFVVALCVLVAANGLVYGFEFLEDL